MDIKHVLSCNPLLPAYRAAPPSAAGASPPKAGWLEHDGGPVEVGHGGGTFGFDNEFPRHRALLDTVRRRGPARHVRRMVVVHGGRRLPTPGVLALRGMGHRQRRALGSTSVLDPDPRRPGSLVGVHSFGDPAGRPRRAGVPRELLRSRRLRAVGRPPATRPSSSGRSPPSSTGRATTSCLLTQRLRLRPTRGRRSRRTPCSVTSGSGRPAPIPPTPASGPPRAQWASTTASSWSASRSCVAGAAPPRRDTSGPPTAISSTPVPAGLSPACGWPGTPERCGTRSTSTSRRTTCTSRCAPTPSAGCWPREVDPARLVLRRAGQPALRGDHSAPRVLPHTCRARPARAPRPLHRGTGQGRHAGRAGCRRV